jgi:2-polyprenyl-6-methoxyphenol hydroxylase-like FAD-dependent oxidoreductase
MSTSSFNIVIIGAGLGGLCLAQGLKKAGIRVAVYERDRAPDDRLQGYRIHIEPQGNLALSACLPSGLFKSYLATSGPAGSGYRISTEQLEELLFFPAPAPANQTDLTKLSLSVSRITLRQILLSGLEDIVHFNKRFTHYQETQDGRITAFFDDGSSATSDLLVAADGSKSRVREQLLPTAQTIATGAVAIMGKLALTEDVKRLLMPGGFDGATSILGPSGHAMFAAIHERSDSAHQAMQAFGSHHDAAFAQDSGLLFDDLSDYIFWALIARQEKYPAQNQMQHLDGIALQKIALAMVQGWHPRLQQLVQQADPSTMICKPLYTSQPIKHWKTRQVTLLGDAIHSMPPTRGMGGNTALRDAQLLCQNLIAAQAGQRLLLQAVGDYERSMIKYGFAAVRSSLQALDLHVAESRRGAKLLLRSVNAVMALQRLGGKKAA